jgi:DNA-binding response OmpR family regulator
VCHGVPPASDTLTNTVPHPAGDVRQIASRMNCHLQPIVLLLDDDPAVRESGRRALEAYGYRCISVDTVEHATAHLWAGSVEALILDVRLPGARSGLDLLREIRRDATMSAVPVIIMTGCLLSPQEEVVITRFRAHLFQKPEGMRTIVTFLDQLTGRDQSH